MFVDMNKTAIKASRYVKQLKISNLTGGQSGRLLTEMNLI